MTRTDQSSTTSDTPSSIEQEQTWLEGIVRNFDVAWQRGDRPTLSNYLPPSKSFTEQFEQLHGSERRSLTTAEVQALLLELARVDLRRRIEAGEPARVETYMGLYPDLAADTELLLELIATEYRHRLTLEPGLPIEGYLARFPDQRNELAQRLGNLTAPPDPDAVLADTSNTPWPVIKDYTILEIIKEGGQGVVFKALQERLNRIVALKVIHRERWSNTEWARKRFAQEARAAAQLLHSHIAIVHDFNQSDEVDYIVMEFVNGINLHDLVVQRGPLPIDEACEYMRQAALGLQHAHERGLVHRDIKPGNLIVTLPTGGVSAGGRPLPFRGAIVKILDMGLARLSVQPSMSEDDSQIFRRPPAEKPGERTPVGSVMGTPDFIAPEQWEDARATDIRADLYSLGCTFYFLLAGGVPFPEGSISSKRKKHRRATPQALTERRTEIPEEVANIVARLMAKSPDERIQTPEELANQLKAFLDSVNHKQTQTQSWPDFMLHGQEGPRRAEDEPLCRLVGHDDWIWNVAFAPDSQHVLSGSRDGAARLWSLADGREVRRFEGHSDEILSVAFNAEGNQLVTGSADGDIRVWETATGKELRRYRGHTDRVLRVGFSQAQLDWLFELLNVSVDYQSRGDLVVSGSRDGTIRLWHPSLGDTPLRRLDIRAEIVSVAFSFDGISALTQSGGHTVQLWGVESDRELCRFEAEANFFWSVALSPDGRRVLSGGDDGTVRLWDVDTGQELRRYRGHQGFVYSVAFSPDGRLAISGSDDKTVRLWDVLSGEELCCYLGHEDAVNAVAFSLDARFAVSGSNDRSLCCWAVQADAGARGL